MFVFRHNRWKIFSYTKVFRYISVYLKGGWSFKSLLHNIYIALNTVQLNISFSCRKACFVYRITQKISDKLWVILGNGCICILNCVSWFVSLILNFNALCVVAHAFQRQSYTMLLKSNRIFCLILGITFGNYFLTVSNEGDDHLWLYFVFFLNQPPMTKLIVKFLHTGTRIILILPYPLYVWKCS